MASNTVLKAEAGSLIQSVLTAASGGSEDEKCLAVSTLAQWPFGGGEDVDTVLKRASIVAILLKEGAGYDVLGDLLQSRSQPLRLNVCTLIINMSPSQRFTSSMSECGTIVTTLVRYLDNAPEDLRGMAANAIRCASSSGSKVFPRAASAAGAMAGLIKMLKSSSARLQEGAAEAITQLVHHSGNRAKEAADGGALQQLLRLTTTLTSDDVQTAAARAIARVVQGLSATQSNFDQITPLVPALVNLLSALSNGGAAVTLDVIEAIVSLPLNFNSRTGPDPIARSLVASGIIEVAVRVAQKSTAADPRLAVAAAGILGRISRLSDKYATQVAATRGAVRLVVQHSAGSSHLAGDLARLIMTSSTQRAAASLGNAVDAVEAGAMGQLLECLKDGTLEAKSDAVRAISKLNLVLTAGGMESKVWQLITELQPAAASLVALLLQEVEMKVARTTLMLLVNVVRTSAEAAARAADAGLAAAARRWQQRQDATSQVATSQAHGFASECLDALRKHGLPTEAAAGAASAAGSSAASASAAASSAQQGTGVCAACGATSGPGGQALSKCSVCRQVAYCSKDCQKKHWKEHKPGCAPRTTTPTGLKIVDY